MTIPSMPRAISRHMWWSLGSYPVSRGQWGGHTRSVGVNGNRGHSSGVMYGQGLCMVSGGHIWTGFKLHEGIRDRLNNIYVSETRGRI